MLDESFDTVESVAVRPSLVREQWLPLDVAVQEIVEFERAFGTEHLWLACHAALPSILTPELINLIRINFLDTHEVYVPWVAECDVLLSPLCRPIDDTLFEVEPMIREMLLFELEERYGWERLRELASFLSGYLKEKQEWKYRVGVAQVQEWIALSYLNPDEVIRELKKLLSESVDLEKDEHLTLSRKFKISTIMEMIADPLEHTTLQQEYHELLHSARLFARVLYRNKDTLRFADAPEQASAEDGASMLRLFPPEVQRWIRTVTRRSRGYTVQEISPPMVLSMDSSRDKNVIDFLLEQAGWIVQEYQHADIQGLRGVAIHNFPLPTDEEGDVRQERYVLFVDQEAVGIVFIIGDKQTLISLEKPISLGGIPLLRGERGRHRVLSFTYSIPEKGAGAQFISYLDPKPRSRSVFTFHRPETLAEWLQQAPINLPSNMNDTLRSRLSRLPELPRTGLSNIQYEAITNLEISLAANRPRTLIQMTTGTGKANMIVSSIYRLIKFSNAQRVLFLVDRNELARQALQTFEQFVTPDDEHKFTELYDVQILQGSTIDLGAKVCITTIQRLYSTLSVKITSNEDVGSLLIVDEAHRSSSIEAIRPIEDLSDIGEEIEAERVGQKDKLVKAVQYNLTLPIETFDVIFIDEIHRSISEQSRAVLEYFDAFLIGITISADKRTQSFFNNNLVYKGPPYRIVPDAQTIIRQLWAYSDNLRDGLPYSDYVEQLTYLLFLKIADERTKPPYNESSRIPRGYDWQSIIQLQGDDLAVHYQHILERLGKETGMLGIIFHNAYNKIRSPAKLHDLIIDLINHENWTSIGTDVLGNVYEGLLQRNFESLRSDGGQYFTPRPLIQAIVDIMRPKPSQHICDPACGTGGFLIAAHDYIEKYYRLDRDQRLALKNDTFYGWEINNNAARLCAMNLFLHGMIDEKSRCPIAVTDSLLVATNELFDMILSNPPFSYQRMIPSTKEAQEDFWVSTSNMDLNFVQLTRSLLNTHGRAAIIVPNNVLFAGGPGEIIRRRLLHDCDLHTILRLPTNIFYHTGISANVLFFDVKPVSPNPWTERLWIYDLNTNQKFSSRRNPITRTDFDDFVASFHPENRHQRQESERFRSFSYDELLARNQVNLNIFWLRDESKITELGQTEKLMRNSKLEPDPAIAETESEKYKHCADVVKRATPRQIEVLRAFAKGLSQKEVARTLQISINTVDSHKTALFGLCREVWNIARSTPLTYHFFHQMFAEYFDKAIDLKHFEKLTQTDMQDVVKNELHDPMPSTSLVSLEEASDEQMQISSPYYTCFISYSRKDQSFAERLYTDLKNYGVRCWFAPEDMKIGDKIRHRIDESIHLYDKLLLVLSEHSVKSQWTEYEIETALDKERRENRDVILPIRLDDSCMESQTAWVAYIRRSRHIGDFQQWKDNGSYQKALHRVIRDLQVEQRQTSIKYYDCYIGYSSKDQIFVERLYADLQSQGIHCWFAPEDLKIGDKYRNRIEDAIRHSNKFLLVLSEHSVTSQWTEFELEAAFEKERQENRFIFIPISLDNSYSESKIRWVEDIRRTRHIRNFQAWKSLDQYQKMFNELLRTLRV